MSDTSLCIHPLEVKTSIEKGLVMDNSFAIYGANSALSTAQLIVINALKYQEEKQKEISRYKFSVESLETMANRRRLSEQFLKDLDEALAELDWVLIRLSKDFAVARMSTIEEKWAKLAATKRLEGLTTLSAEDINAKYEELVARETSFSENIGQ